MISRLVLLTLSLLITPFCTCAFEDLDTLFDEFRTHSVSSTWNEHAWVDRVATHFAHKSPQEAAQAVLQNVAMRGEDMLSLSAALAVFKEKPDFATAAQNLLKDYIANPRQIQQLNLPEEKVATAQAMLAMLYLALEPQPGLEEQIHTILAQQEPLVTELVKYALRKNNVELIERSMTYGLQPSWESVASTVRHVSFDNEATTILGTLFLKRIEATNYKNTQDKVIDLIHLMSIAQHNNPLTKQTKELLAKTLITLESPQEIQELIRYAQTRNGEATALIKEWYTELRRYSGFIGWLQKLFNVSGTMQAHGTVAIANLKILSARQRFVLLQTLRTIRTHPEEVTSFMISNLDLAITPTLQKKIELTFPDGTKMILFDFLNASIRKGK